MSCNHPLYAFWTGSYTANGKKELEIIPNRLDFIPVDSLSKGKTFRMEAPHRVINGIMCLVDPIPLPCGNCLGCRMSRAKEWRNRMLIESLDCKNTYFITLTYRDECCPQDLKKSDIQKFIKWLRKDIKFRYFYCGEYGDKTQRPHFHMVMFTDYDLTLKEIGLNAFKCPEIESKWKYGISSVSIADSGCLAYVAGYVEKKQKAWFNNYPVPPFVNMSLKPALGSWYLEKHKESLLKTQKIYVDGKACNTPRFFWRKLEEEIDLSDIKEELVERARKSLDMKKHYCHSTDIDDIGDFYEKLIEDQLNKVRIDKGV